MSDIPPENFYLYCVSSAEFEKRSLYKLGLTIHPVHRLRQYATGVPPSLINSLLIYKALWKIGTKTREQLHEMEGILHRQFADRRDGTSEWFNVTPQEVIDFLLTPQKFTVEQVSPDDVKDVNTKSKQPLSSYEEDAYDEEEMLIKEQEVLRKKAIRAKKVETLYEKFLRVFLPGKLPRRIQTELWDLFQEICRNPEDLCYRAIVQWPTGVGKTIATLMLIVIAAERCKVRGEIYRGLLISPRNDIFNTISGDFMKLSEFGISLYDGSNAKLSSLTLPRDKHILVMACPQSLLSEETGMRRLPPISHIHSDEVHRITGEKCFQLLKIMMVEWNTQILTGTSATPKTSCPEQHRKLAELFGEPYTILHKCDVDEAVREGWIAVPRFKIVTTPKQTKENEGAYAKAVVSAIVSTVNDKKNMGLWKGGKMIMYLPNIAMTLCVEKEAKAAIPKATIYLAVGERTDKEFVSAPADGSLRILFACDRYREGSDIKGLEMTGVLTGDTISAYILIQIQGRSLRTDYVGKEGWCLIVSPCEEREDENDVMDRISLNILGLLGDSRPLVKKDIERYVEAYFGNVFLGGALISKEETVKRIQTAYERREFVKRTPKEKYESIRRLNKELGIVSKDAYNAIAPEHPKYIPDPKAYFEGCWNCWYDFLGVDTTSFPQTKSEWIRTCKDMGLTTWDLYKQKKTEILPMNPGEMYEDYTNWHKEFNIEEEIVW
jgi:superfamily II DNA or RNA helicase